MQKFPWQFIPLSSSQDSVKVSRKQEFEISNLCPNDSITQQVLSAKSAVYSRFGHVDPILRDQ